MGAWCSGITSASHAEGLGLNPQCVHVRACCSRMHSHPRARLCVHARARNWPTAAHAPRESPQHSQPRPQLRPCALTPADVRNESNATTQRRFRVGAARSGIAVTRFGSRLVALPCYRGVAQWLAHTPRDSFQHWQPRPQLRTCALTPADISNECDATTQRGFRLASHVQVLLLVGS